MLELHKPWYQGKDFESSKRERERENWEESKREGGRKGHLFTLFPHHFPIFFSLFLHFPSLFNHFFVLTYHFLSLSSHPTLQLAPFSCVCQYHPQITDNNIFDAASSGLNCSICENGMVIQLQSNSILQKCEKRTNIDHHKMNITKKRKSKITMNIENIFTSMTKNVDNKKIGKRNIWKNVDNKNWQTKYLEKCW